MPSVPGRDKVLIVGAGAMGLTVGYHLHLAGAQITFLVRPLRALQLANPQTLYSYDDGRLKTFSDFKVVTAIDAVPALSLDYVLVTLDGTATRSTDGVELLGTLGETLAANTTIMIGGGVGVGLREHYLAVTRLPSNRILMGVLGSFAYQPHRATLPLLSPTDPALLARADIAYRHYSKRGFMVEGRFPEVAQRFAALFNKNGAVCCAVMNPNVYEILTNMPFPIFAGSELLGWPRLPELVRHKQVWRLTCKAVREIARLERHGWRGRLAAFLLTDWMVAKMWRSVDRGSRPLDFQAFNAFHHGAKVAAQDTAILRQCVAAGEVDGKPLKALHDLLQQLAVARAGAKPT